MKKNLHSFKPKKHANNLNGQTNVNQNSKREHTISNFSYEKKCKQFYLKNANLMIDLAEQNISTIGDLYYYLSWLKLYGEL